MKLRRKNKLIAEVATSSMNDIMFFLMLFFLIMSTLLNPNVIKLTLPNSKHSLAIHKKEISLSITKDLNYFLENKPVAFGQLETELQRSVASEQDATVILRCDNALTIQDLVNVLEIGNKLKIKMILATRTANAPAAR